MANASIIQLPIPDGKTAARRRPTARVVTVGLVIALLALIPVYSSLASQPTYLTLFSRIMIYALAALGLNLVLGYGALVSFGHALYIGIGAYAVGMLSTNGITNGFAHLGAALAVGLGASVVIGLICLRTGGIAFIMITLAFAQMIYFLAVGLKNYGGDDGLPIAARSDFGALDLSNNVVLYYVIFAILIATLYAIHRLVNARFGMVLRGAKVNPHRMAALGFSALPYQLAAYVISALVCVVAGVLLANLTSFASPAYMEWSLSGELIAMIVLGGLGSLVGPIIGAGVWLLLQELLTSVRLGLPWGLDDMLHDHWMLVLGAVVVLVTLGLKQGLYGWLLEDKE
ncbi:branched-chain amino acid ABC transporter permease [Variovorax sp. dw_954]|uniref:branched-chain amino acid ABC transporter permease n=1 Tax=Variovorax sp. dw_954 TaxID=2720078 RepID=UPI001BD4DCFB|nr:branched-chain amino acid ABC transporter permease [Variovorax sp. dw_954]